jgi:hypothetical protein
MPLIRRIVAIFGANPAITIRAHSRR